ncbi:hypothetical protein GCM10010246_24760 [Streptomyces cuspidosporus]|uniref:Uncharacterized protein n=1 Tax=Streptomyces cuspidosporus TaxID=66882 RepID=A0ABN3FWC9_9ACTN
MPHRKPGGKVRLMEALPFEVVVRGGREGGSEGGGEGVRRAGMRGFRRAERTEGDGAGAEGAPVTR